jgi:hypothetical protein
MSKLSCVLSGLSIAVLAGTIMLPVTSDAKSRIARDACKRITPENAARCCAQTRRQLTPDNSQYCAYNFGYYAPDNRNRLFGAANAGPPARGATTTVVTPPGSPGGGNGGPPGGGGGGGGGPPPVTPVSNLNPAGHAVPGIGVGILAPNNGPPGPGPGFGPSGNPGLGGNGPPGQSK